MNFEKIKTTVITGSNITLSVFGKSKLWFKSVYLPFADSNVFVLIDSSSSFVFSDKSLIQTTIFFLRFLSL